MKECILEVKDLSISFTQYATGFQLRTLTPVKSLNIKIHRGEILAIVGASGSGKSLLAHAIMRILPVNATVNGEIFYKNKLATKRQIEALRGKEIAFIPQSVNYLDPLMKVRDQVKIGLPKVQAQEIQESLFEKYELKKSDGALYPYQLSGGMLRRVLFATSVKDGINLVIADEPTPGIHPEALQTILRQLRAFADTGMAVMLITHDIISALSICDYVTIFRDGAVVETASADKFSGDGSQLETQYARRLWRALPQNDFTGMEDLDGAAV